MLFALGREKGLKLGERLGLDVIMIDEAHKVYLTPGVSTYFELADPIYEIEKERQRS